MAVIFKPKSTNWIESEDALAILHSSIHGDQPKTCQNANSRITSHRTIPLTTRTNISADREVAQLPQSTAECISWQSVCEKVCQWNSVSKQMNRFDKTFSQIPAAILQFANKCDLTKTVVLSHLFCCSTALLLRRRSVWCQEHWQRERTGAFSQDGVAKEVSNSGQCESKCFECKHQLPYAQTKLCARVFTSRLKLKLGVF